MKDCKNTASIFPEISFIQYFTIFRCQQYDVITDLICIIEKRQYLKTKKDISKRKTPFFSILKGLSNTQKIFLMHVICTLRTAELKSLCNVVSSIYQLFVPHFAMAVFMCIYLRYCTYKQPDTSKTSFEFSSILSTVDLSEHLITA